MSKPRVYSLLWRRIPAGGATRRWHVDFQGSCGCTEEADFATFSTALRFARHIALGGSRWEFVE